MTGVGKRTCTAHTAAGKPCKGRPISGSTVCRMHGGSAPQVRAKAAVVAEVLRWGLGDTTVDPGEVLLRLVSQSAARTARYARLLEQAYDAAERLKEAHAAQELLVADDPGCDEDGLVEPAAIQRARADLDRIFTTGGVAALVGATYADTKLGQIYATGEAIRGLAQLEAQERDRCATMAAKAITAGLAERQVRLAERQAEIVIAAVEAALEAAGVPVVDRGPAKLAAARHLKAV
ncbi:HGGxSTG domain-containing protein [Actinocrispum wychmicini]|uniref:Uncharacterized protein n=1 Tax=Actinocrispum wychmicini TaxID=1213861 RepID=A0A4R2JSI4_9PSEU|nr:HGGxSTG domain-containing protein [Actinocrispum wychmicini]TCO57135.1 hypothetical protein EV192_106612 [Actinocrispum wychmicini]